MKTQKYLCANCSLEVSMVGTYLNQFYCLSCLIITLESRDLIIYQQIGQIEDLQELTKKAQELTAQVQEDNVTSQAAFETTIKDILDSAKKEKQQEGGTEK